MTMMARTDEIEKSFRRADTQSRADLVTAWHAAFGSASPKYVSLSFMRKALAFDIQCKAFGGLSAAVRKSLKAVANGKPDATGNSGSLSPGTHLVREWNGRTYQVEVLREGFLMDGRTHRSLTAIARKITGSNWSGPRFFGLTGRSGP